MNLIISTQGKWYTHHMNGVKVNCAAMSILMLWITSKQNEVPTAL